MWRRGATGLSVVMILAGCPKRFDPRAETVRAAVDGPSGWTGILEEFRKSVDGE